jgi:uncharacterized protein (DUF111 family)
LSGQVLSGAPEHEDCAALARQAGLPLETVRQTALSAWRALQSAE